MKPFKYALNSLQRVRKVERDQSLAESLSIQGERQKHLDHVQAQQNQLLESEQQARAAIGSGILDLDQYQAGIQYLAASHQRLQSAQAGLEKVDIAYNQAKEQLKQKEISLRLLDEHQVKAKIDHNEQQKRIESRQIDELWLTSRRFSNEANS